MAFVGIAAAGWLYFENNIPTVSHYYIKKGLRRPVRLLQISDLHGKSFSRNQKRLIQAVAQNKPDLIVITGDSVNSSGRGLYGAECLVARACLIAPVVMIAGNHEQRSGHCDDYLNRFSQLGAVTLKNEFHRICLNDIEINFLGLCEQQSLSTKDYFQAITKTMHYTDNRHLLTKLEQMNGLRILLSHFPENFAMIDHLSYNQFEFDLMLSGHLHGGQWRIPPQNQAVFSTGQGFFPKYSQGHHRSCNGSSLIVSRGLGNGRLLPRVNNRPEIVVVDFV